MSEIPPIVPSSPLPKVLKVESDHKSPKQPPKQKQSQPRNDQDENDAASGHIDEIV